MHNQVLVLGLNSVVHGSRINIIILLIVESLTKSEMGFYSLVIYNTSQAFDNQLHCYINYPQTFTFRLRRWQQSQSDLLCQFFLSFISVLTPDFLSFLLCQHNRYLDYTGGFSCKKMLTLNLVACLYFNLV